MKAFSRIHLSSMPTRAGSGDIGSVTTLRLSPHLRFLRRTQAVSSTQDEARRILDELYQQYSNDNSSHSPAQLASVTTRTSTSVDDAPNEWVSSPATTELLQGSQCLAVVASTQTKGRGTQGRLWKAGPGNLYLTMALPLDRIPVRLTLLPLQVAVVVAECVQELLVRQGISDARIGSTSRPRVTVKWPNDVLIDHRKVSGTLIENHYCGSMAWFLIGIGVNVVNRPDLNDLPGKHAREPTCICEWVDLGVSSKSTAPITNLGESPSGVPPVDLATELGLLVANKLTEWAICAPQRNEMAPSHASSEQEEERNKQVLQRWIQWVDFGQVYELRGQVVDEEQGGYEGERVVTVGIEPDGQLRVRGANGRERLLVADYLF